VFKKVWVIMSWNARSNGNGENNPGTSAPWARASKRGVVAQKSREPNLVPVSARSTPPFASLHYRSDPIQ
jgi:hypothetical protein